MNEYNKNDIKAQQAKTAGYEQRAKKAQTHSDNGFISETLF